ncbi:MAG: GIY-YIG nuclease family protein, partial [Psychrobacillus sp.]
MTVGIYVIRNNINNKAYIGQSVSIETRKNSHV